VPTQRNMTPWQAEEGGSSRVGGCSSVQRVGKAIRPSPRPQKRRGRHSAPGKKTGDPCTDSSQPVFRNIAPQLKKLANHAPNHMANATGRFQLEAPLSKAWKKVVASRTSTG
jgi:hypothetical protein